MLRSRTLLGFVAAALGIAGLSMSANAQIGTGWTATTETFSVQTTGSGTVSGNTFSLSYTSTGTTKDRAERRYQSWSSGQHQFQGDVKVTSLGGNLICLKQTFQETVGPWNMLAINKSGYLYEHATGTNLAAYSVGSTARINTIFDCSAGTVQVYINGSLKETRTGGQNPIYNKCGTYRTDSGTAPITATWSNVLFWKK
jgi:hypothetical protein